MNKKYLFSLVFILPFVFSSCLQEVEELGNIKGVKLQSQIAFPLFQDEVGVKELYDAFSNSAFVRLENDQSITFIYATRDSLQQRQFISIPPIPISFNLTADASIATAFNTLGSVNQSLDVDMQFPVLNGEQFKRIDVKTGQISFVFSSDFKHNTKIIVNFPSLRRLGVPLVDTIDLTYQGVSPVVVNKTYNIQDYRFDLSKNGTSFNEFPYTVGFSVEKVSGNPNMLPGEAISVSGSVNITSYKTLIGYMGKFTILSTRETVPLDIFSNQVGGNVAFSDPRMRVEMFNGFGLPITGRVSDFYVNLTNGTRMPVSVDLLKDTFTLPYAQLAGDYGIGEYLFSKLNSNIDDLINNAPRSISFKMDFIANYNEVPTDNFMFDTSTLKSNVNIELPFDFKVFDYAVQNSGDFSFPGDSATGLEDARLVSEATNSLPVAIVIQAFFAKKKMINGVDSFEIIDSLFAEGLKLAGANVDASGAVISPSTATSVGFLDKEKYKRLQEQKCDFYYLVMRSNTSESSPGNKPFVKIYGTQKATLKVGLEASAKFNTTQ